MNKKNIICALFLGWLCLTGSYNGWQRGPLLVINVWMAFILIAWGWTVARREAPRALTWPLFVFWSWAILASAGETVAIVRIVQILTLIACYHLAIDSATLRRAGRWLAWFIFPLIIFFPWENGNSLSFLVWGLLWLGWGWGWWALGLVALATTSSEGGLLAVAGGGAAWAWLRWPEYRKMMRWPLAGGAVVAGAGMLAIKWWDSSSFGKRLEIFNYAWSGFADSPIVGHGLNTFGFRSEGWYTIDPHNLILLILWETGLVGLILVGWLAWRIISQHKIAPWVGGWLASFIIHSMVDGPLVASFFNGVVLFMILGGLPCKERITLDSLWPFRWPWPWPASLKRFRARFGAGGR